VRAANRSVQVRPPPPAPVQHGHDGLRRQHGATLGDQGRSGGATACAHLAQPGGQRDERVHVRRVESPVRHAVQRWPLGHDRHVQHTHGHLGHRQHHGAHDNTETQAQGRHQNTRDAHAPGHRRSVGHVFNDAVGNYMGMDRTMATGRSALSHFVVFSNIWIVSLQFHIDMYQRR